MNNLTRIKNELLRAGFKLEPIQKLESDQDYSQMIGNCVYSICDLFAKQQHSGSSAHYTKMLLQKLLIDDSTLSPLTNNKDEWQDVSKESGYTLYQSKRNFSCFSEDLVYYYDINDKDEQGYVYRRLAKG